MADSSIDDALTAVTAANRFAKGGNADAGRVVEGVTLTWLSQVFEMTPYELKKKLRNCPTKPARDGRTGAYYDLPTAAAYLVTPRIDVDEYMKNVKPTDMPAHLQDQYWSAMNKKQKWEEAAGHLWRSEKVLAVFGDVFQLVKGSIQLWPDAVERAVGMNAEQKRTLRAQCDGLQKDIHTRLLQMPDDQHTGPQLDEFEAPSSEIGPEATVHDDLI